MSDDKKISRPPLDEATKQLLGNPVDDQVANAAARHNEEHAGGTVVIQYESKWVFTAPLRHVAEAVRDFTMMPRSERRAMMQSINCSIATLFPLVKARTATQEQFMACAMDVALWHACEIVEGRATWNIHNEPERE